MKIPDDVMRVDPPPKVVDPGAARALARMLADAVAALKETNADPVAIAASPNRFNDIYWSEWLAVRTPGFFTDQHDFGPSGQDFRADIAAGPREAQDAARVLDLLERGGWRGRFQDAFGLAWGDEVLGLVVQGGAAWLVFCESNMADRRHVFAVAADNAPSYVGECDERFDDGLENLDAPPLVFARRDDSGAI